MLQTTALIHEAFLRLAALEELRFQDRNHFFAVAGTMMRRVLVDAARMRDRQKRGAGISLVGLDNDIAAPDVDLDLFKLNDALDRLAALDARQAQIVELRFFAGFSIEQIADALELSAATVKREWAIARMWLYRELART